MLLRAAECEVKMKQEEIVSIIKEIADKNYDLFLLKGYAAPGNNGPYGHKDTPVRNTAHWLITYAYLWKKTGDKKYEEIVKRFADYLIQGQAKTQSGAIKCMYEEKFDHLNGLIGQAWVIEALVYAATAFGREDYYETALKIFSVPRYNEKKHLWERVELDGTNIGFDYTFNHQLWLAAAGSLLLDYKYDKKTDLRIRDFLEGCLEHFRVHKNGLIKHYVNLKRPGHKVTCRSLIKKCLKFMCRPFKAIDPDRFDLSSYETGYHLFNLFGFALLYNRYKDCMIFRTGAFRKALAFGLDIKKLNRAFNIYNYLKRDNSRFIKFNKYSYAYNSPAFEYPYISKIFTNNCNDKITAALFKLQMELTYDKTDKMFSRNNADEQTLTARLYELVRYLDTAW